MRTVVERSAGGVVCRQGEQGLEVILIATHGGTRWALPKGLVERGEKPVDTARREIQEETGVEARYLGKIDTIEYWYRQDKDLRVHKFVAFYLFEYVAGDVANHGWEVDDAAWFPIDEAIARISYDTERKILQRARELWPQLQKPET